MITPKIEEEYTWYKAMTYNGVDITFRVVQVYGSGFVVISILSPSYWRTKTDQINPENFDRLMKAGVIRKITPNSIEFIKDVYGTFTNKSLS